MLRLSAQQFLPWLETFSTEAFPFMALRPDASFSGDESMAYGAWETRRALVICGSPLTQDEGKTDAARRIVETSAKKSVIWCGIRTTEWLPSHYIPVKVGASPIWDVDKWDEKVAQNRSLRMQIQRCRNKGLTYSMEHEDDVTHAVLRQTLLQQWQASKPLPPLDFVQSSRHCFGVARTHWHMAWKDGQLVAAFRVITMTATKEYFVESALRGKAAPNGVVESLLNELIGHAKKSAMTSVTLEPTPLVPPNTLLFGIFRRAMKPFYNSEGLCKFRQKMHPDRWVNIYLAYPKRSGLLTTLLTLSQLFCGGHIGRFVWKSVLWRFHRSHNS